MAVRATRRIEGYQTHLFGRSPITEQKEKISRLTAAYKGLRKAASTYITAELAYLKALSLKQATEADAQVANDALTALHNLLAKDASGEEKGR
jgi:hypothetical protein